MDRPRNGIPSDFKWIKQHLRIKAFYGTSENAAKTQIWIAVSVYVLVAIAIEAALYQILPCSRKPPFHRHFSRSTPKTIYHAPSTN
jgi:IS4 transposase